ncbi:MAG: hypothetical protein K6F80_02715 [Oscillospiraceae bacterium]|nr:hypothetical protein [Oscillospiraceae bacterium]
MSNRAKLLISILFIAAIVLTIGLTRFYFDVTKNNGKNDSANKTDSVVRRIGNMQVFTSESGFCGLVNADGVVVIEPEWLEILDAQKSVVLVSSRIGDEVLIGGIDYEENLVLPIVFRSFQDLGKSHRAGIVAADDMRIIYDKDYRMAFPNSYEDAACEGDNLILTRQDCSFLYSMKEDKPRLLRAGMVTPVSGQRILWRVSNQVFLSELSEEDLLRISECTTAYLDMLLRDDFSSLASISSSDYISGLSKPGTMPDAKIDKVYDFSFSRQEPGCYDLAFTASYREQGERVGKQSVQMHLLFRKGNDDHILLTAANLDFQSAEKPLPVRQDEDETDEEEEETDS